MADDWRDVPLSELAELSGGYAFKSQDYAPSGRFVLRTLNIRDDCSITLDDPVYLPEELAPQYQRFELKPHDTLFVMVGATLGKVGYVRGRDLPALLNQNMWRIRAKTEVADPRFVHYAFRHAVKENLGWASGSARDFVRRDDYRSLKISTPSITEQRAIAHILGSLDDKIELNRRMSETLEATARALFKSWFVDFDPVRAKSEGQDSGLAKPLSDLFPDSFEESALGDIPKGWEVGSVGSIAPQRTERVGSQKAIVLSAVATGKLVKSDDQFKKRVYSQETHKYLLVEQWDVAYNPSRINIGSIGMLDEEIVGAVSPVYVVARPRAAYRWFLAFFLRLPQTRTWINTLASGSVRQSLSYHDFSSIPIVVPPARLAEEFGRKWSAVRDSIRARQAESKTLADLRDGLLPKLVSGDLRVKDAERFIGKAS